MIYRSIFNYQSNDIAFPDSQSQKFSRIIKLKVNAIFIFQAYPNMALTIAAHTYR